MNNLETWVRQLNGELNVQEIAKTAVPPKEDIVAPYSVFLRMYDKVGLLAATNKRRWAKCNVEFVFDGNSRKLKDVRLINQDNEDGN
jgi:regulation of enolase protein 1 (concanavalin A-like superfamily)